MRLELKHKGAFDKGVVSCEIYRLFRRYIGGVRRGLEKSGHKCAGWCEWDRFARQSYEAIHNTEGEWTANDIRTVRATDIPRADLWCFGFPCTDISVAGKQKGFFTEEGEQTRSGLFYEIIRLLRELPKEDRPKWLLAENVKNLLSIENGWGFTECLCALGEVGYDIEWQLFNTKYSYNVAGVCVPGIPQNRERVYLVGRLVGTASGRKVFPIDRADGENIAELSQIGKQASNTRDNPNQGRVYDTEGLAPTLNCMGGGGREPHIVDNNSQAYRVYDKEGLSPTLTCGHDGNQPHIVEENSVKQIGFNPDNRSSQRYRAYDTDGTSPTLCAGMGEGGNTQPMVIDEPTTKQIGHIEGYKVDNPQAYRVYDASGTAPTLVRASDGKVPWVVDDNDVKEVGYATSKDGNKIQSSRVYDKDGLSPTLTTDTGGNQQPMIVDDLYAGREPRVYKDSCPTLRSERSGIKVVGNYSPSGYNATRVVDAEGIAPTVMENHGQATAVTVKAVLTPDRIEKRQNGRRMKEDGEPMFTLTAQDKHGVAIQEEVLGGVQTNQSKDFQRGILPGLARTLRSGSHDSTVAILSKERNEYGKAVRKAYESGEVQEQRKNMTQYVERTDGMSNTLTTVTKDNLVVEHGAEPMPKVIGGVGNPNDFGKQFRQGNRIYSTETVAPALQTNNGNASGGSVLIQHETDTDKICKT